MNLRIQNQAQPELDASAAAKTGSAQPGVGSSPGASPSAAPQDTASISAATSQLTGDVAIRQDRVEALRSQIESGTYTVNPHAVATAMFQNLFRS